MSAQTPWDDEDGWIRKRLFEDKRETAEMVHIVESSGDDFCEECEHLMAEAAFTVLRTAVDKEEHARAVAAGVIDDNNLLIGARKAIEEILTLRHQRRAAFLRHREDRHDQHS